MKRRLMQGTTHVLFGIPATLALAGILAPLIEVSGWPRVANRLYFLLSYVCHQIPSHSLWLFGAPTGISSRSLFLYLGFVGAALPMIRRRCFVSWPNSLLLLIPVLLDVATELAGWRETTNPVRVATGALAGIGLAGLVAATWHRLALRVGQDTLPTLSILNRATAALVILVFLGTVLPYGIAKAEDKVAIPEGTRVVVKTEDSTTSATATQGQVVRFGVVRAVEIQGKVVIKAGAPATGEVLRVEGKKMIGREGELLVGIRYATAVDGSQIPLRASFEKKGEGMLATSVVLGVVLCPLFLLMKGEEARIPAGTEYTVFVDRPAAVKVE